MADTPEQRAARKELRRVQADFERKVEEARAERRAAFERAQKAGLSLRQIGEEAGLHHTRVRQVIGGK